MTYKAMQHKEFPSDRLNNVISLAGPFNLPPHFLSTSLDSMLNDIVTNFNFTRYENTAHFNFNGGLRDFHVTSQTTPYEKILK